MPNGFLSDVCEMSEFNQDEPPNYLLKCKNCGQTKWLLKFDMDDKQYLECHYCGRLCPTETPADVDK